VLLRAIQRSNTMSPEIKHILQLIALTSRRPNEVCNIEIEHIERWAHPDYTIINLPPPVMKAGLRYLVPVCPMAREVITAALFEHKRNAQMGRESKYLFPSVFSNEREDQPISPTSVAQAMQRLIENLNPEAEEDARVVTKLKQDRPTPYAFRRSVSNGLAQLGVTRENRKAVMAHAEDDVLAGHYEPYDRLKETRAALMIWEAHLTSVTIQPRCEQGELLPAR
jgi:integrase